MYNLKNVKIKNFLSFRTEQEFNFSNIPYLVLGENTDRDNQESNGSGKSSFIEAVFFALAGETLRKINNSKVFHLYTQDNAGHVELCLENEFGEKLIIKRNIFKNKSFSVSINFKNENIVKTSVNEYNEYIEFLTGVKKEDIINYYILSKEKSVNFTQISDTRKKEIINRFSNINIIDGTDIKCLEENILYEKNINDKKIQIERVNGKIEGLKESFEKENKENFENDKKLRIENEGKKYDNYLDSKTKIVGSLEVEILEKEQQIKNIKEKEILASGDIITENKKKIEGLNLEIDNFNKEIVKNNYLIESQNNVINDKKLNIKTSEENKQVLFETLKSKNLEKHTIDLTINNIENKLKKLITCPKCSHEFILNDEDFDLEEEKINIQNHKNTILRINVSIDDCYKQIESIEKIIFSINAGIKNDNNKLSEILELVNVHKKEIKNKNDSVETLENKIELENKALRQYDLKLKILGEEIDSNLIRADNIRIEVLSQKEKFEEKCLVISKEVLDYESIKKANLESIQLNLDLIETYNAEIADIIKKIETNSYSIDVFKRFKNHLSNQNLQLIQDTVNNYFNKINSDINIRIKETKETGKIVKEQIDVIILRDEIERNYNEFSSGEKAQINLGFIFCMQEIINKSTDDKGLNFLFLDEILDSLDTLGVKSVMDSIETMGKCIVIVSHNKGGNTFDNSINIKIQQGQSLIN